MRPILNLLPDDGILLGMGQVAVRHSHLDYAFTMWIKTIGDISSAQAVHASSLESSSSLRKRVRKLARQRLGDGPELVKLDALFGEARELSRQRNEFLHALWGTDVDASESLRYEDGAWVKPSTKEDLERLAQRLHLVANQLHELRLHELKERLKKQPAKQPLTTKSKNGVPR